MQSREDAFGLPLGFGIGRGLMELLCLFERIESLKENFVDLRRRHPGLAWSQSESISAVLRAVLPYIRVQNHMIIWFGEVQFLALNLRHPIQVTTGVMTLV